MNSQQRWLSVLTVTLGIDLFVRFVITFEFTRVMNVEAVLFSGVAVVLALLVRRESDARSWPRKWRVGLVLFFALGGLRCILFSMGFPLVVANFGTLAVFIFGVLVWSLLRMRKTQELRRPGPSMGTMPEPPSGNVQGIVIDVQTLRQLILLFVSSAIVYTLFSYGGIRSPDSEVVFLTAEELATNGTFGLNKDLPGLQGFGLPKGNDGRYYSIFGPGQSIASVPLLRIALWINESEWYKKVPHLIPVSHYVGNGLVMYVNGQTPDDLEPHALRFLVCSFNVVVCSLCVCIFFLLVKLLTRSDLAAWCVTILFAFGSLLMPYSGTFFSEPLATLFIVLSLYCLVWNDLHKDILTKQEYLSLLASGVFLGLAITVHISAALYGPFFFVYALYPFLRTERSAKKIFLSAGLYLAGVGLFLGLLGYYNELRFGNVFETGRTAVPKMMYAVYVAPWRGLYGLIFGSGKGILWFCPAIFAGMVLWRPFHRRFPFLSYTIIAALLFRFCFLASRSDWHGGFCLGPRYLLMTIPLLMLPLGIIVAEWAQHNQLRQLRLFFLFSFFCISEQIYFCVGEIFSFLHVIKWNYFSHGLNVFKHDALYLEWNKSPLLFLLESKRGPFLLQAMHVSNYTLWLFGAALTGVVLFAGYIGLLRKHVGRWR